MRSFKPIWTHLATWNRSGFAICMYSPRQTSVAATQWISWSFLHLSCVARSSSVAVLRQIPLEKWVFERVVVVTSNAMTHHICISYLFCRKRRHPTSCPTDFFPTKPLHFRHKDFIQQWHFGCCIVGLSVWNLRQETQRSRAPQGTGHALAQRSIVTAWFQHKMAHHARVNGFHHLLDDHHDNHPTSSNSILKGGTKIWKDG